MNLTKRAQVVRLAAASLAVTGVAMAGATPSRAASPTYVTIQVAHTEASLTDGNCHELPGVVSIQKQAATYLAMGIKGVTGTVITSWMNETTRQCRRPYLMASWQEMVGLQRNDGWSFVGGSVHAPNLTKVDLATAKTEICQSGRIIAQHGLTGAFGEFAFPGGPSSPQLEQLALSCGYAFGRRYTGGPNPLPIAKPYFVNTYSLNGGACAEPSNPCYELPTAYRYSDPARLVALGRQNPGHWTVVQGYAFVTGAVRSDTLSWDCTSQDWRDHWTLGGVATEVYCWNDWLTAVKTWRGLTYVAPNQMRNQRQA